METNQARVNNLIDYVQGLMNKENGKELYLNYKNDIEKVTPQEAFEIFHSLLLKGSEPRDVLVLLDKVINVFYKSLKAYTWEKPEENSFMGYLIQENSALAQRLESIKEIIKEKDLNSRKTELLAKLKELQGFNDHYLKKENILFPYMEKKMKKFDGLSIMWALHEVARTQLKTVIECIEADNCCEAEFNSELGSLFFTMYGLIQKEELILFPAASEVINDSEWKEMHEQSFDYGFPFIKKPKRKVDVRDIPEIIASSAKELNDSFQFKTETGILDFEQLLMIFDALPVDITFVDENNKVKFFSRPKDRIFPRSPAIIGRNVEMCHPPESVHVVNRIIDAFRAGEKDNAVFWINVKGKMLMIQYFALRDSKGSYKGVLEVSQDITEIRKLEGERRLLHWEDK